MAARGRTKGLTGTARSALALPERLRRALIPVAFAAGWTGVAGLAGCALLAALPPERWPAGLDPAALPLYAVISLSVASLLGWGRVQHGQTRVRRTVGRPAAVALYVVLPLAAALLSILDSHVLEGGLAAWPGGRRLALFARWTTPALVLVSLVAFLAWRTRPAKKVYLARGAGFAVLVTPYALLLAVILFDLPAPWVEEPVEETLGTVGESSLVLQLIVGYFLGDGSAD